MDKSLFKRAIADTEEPISGYMYREMAQWTFKDHSTQTRLINALFEKLKLKCSVNVLFKVLRIIKVLCELGHCEFQKELQKNVYIEAIKVFVNYRGTADVRHGDRLNEKVRQAAREAIDAIFTHRKEDKLAIQAGHGNTTVEQPSKSDTTNTNFTSGRSFLVEPMGPYNQRIAPMPSNNKWAEHMEQQAKAVKTNKATRMLSALAEKAKNGLGITIQSDSTKGFRTAKDQLYENVLKLSATGSNSAMSFAPNAGGFRPVELEAIGTSLSAPMEGSSDGCSGWKFIEEVKILEHTGESHKVGFGGVSSISQQLHQQQPKQLYITPFQDVVQRICRMKDTPQRVELSAFVARCHRLGSGLIQERGATAGGDAEDDWECWEELAEALDAQLAQKQPWQWRLNALACLEALLSAHADDVASIAVMRQAVMQYFRENPEDVQRNVLVVQATLRERAQHVVRMLGLPDVNSFGEKVGCQSLEPQLPAVVEQTRDTGNTMNAFSSLLQPFNALPTGVTEGGMGSNDNVTGSSAADMRGMSLRVNQRGMRDKTTLRKRAPMRLNTELYNHTMETDNGFQDLNKSHMNSDSKDIFFLDKAAVASFTKNYDSDKKDMGKDVDVLDAIFGETSAPSFPVDQLSPNVAFSPAPASCGHASKETFPFHKNGEKAFDFPAGAVGGGSVAPATAQQQSLFSPTPLQSLFLQPQDTQPVAPVSNPSLLAGGPLLSVGNTMTSSADKSNGERGKERSGGVNSSDAASDHFSLLCPQEPAAATTTTSLPSMILEMQRHLQGLLVNLQRESDPEALARLQVLVAQQQQLLQLFSQRREEAPAQACWGASSPGAACGPDAGAVPLHSHFMMGAADSTNSFSSLNVFAEMQKEMMNKYSAPNLQQ